ncbi:MAG: hypothetical protein NTU59_02070 [Coprothermobacterota bacterium]|nr:hypothetical protein [Coprothermobacterota bacterium]
MKVIVILLTLGAAIAIFVAGWNMNQIQTEDGNSIMEHYYRDMGVAVMGVAALVMGLGLAVSSLPDLGGILTAVSLKRDAERVLPPAAPSLPANPRE